MKRPQEEKDRALAASVPSAARTSHEEQRTMPDLHTQAQPKPHGLIEGREAFFNHLKCLLEHCGKDIFTEHEAAQVEIQQVYLHVDYLKKHWGCK
jgi:hypothetical protein